MRSSAAAFVLCALTVKPFASRYFTHLPQHEQVGDFHTSIASGAAAKAGEAKAIAASTMSIRFNMGFSFRRQA